MKKISFSLLLLFLIQFSNCFRNADESGLVSVEFSIVTEDHLLIAPVSIGTPEQELALILDIGADKTWIHKDIYTSQASTSYKDLEIEDSIDEEIIKAEGNLATETFKVNETKLDEFSFLKADTISGYSKIQGVLSLGREYASKKFSFVYRLTASAGTFFNAFTLTFDEETNKGRLYIGDLNDELQKETYLMDKCELANNELKIKWGCQLTHMFFGDLGNNTVELKEEKDKAYIIDKEKTHLKEIGKVAHFETIFYKILLPFSEGEEYVRYFENYFINDKGEKVCMSINDEDKISFQCNEEEISHLKNVNFVFDSKLVLYLTPQDLFACLGGLCKFAIGTQKGVDHFVFGTALLKKFSTVFDYGSKELTFRGKTNKAKVQFDQGMGGFAKFLLTVFIILCCVIVIGVCYVFFVRRKNKSRKQLVDEIYQKL